MNTWKENVLYLGLLALVIGGGAVKVIDSKLVGQLAMTIVGFVIGRYIPTKAEGAVPIPVKKELSS